VPGGRSPRSRRRPSCARQFFALRTEEPPDPLHAAFAALREARPDLFAADRPLSEAELAASGIAVQRGGIAWMAPGGTTTEERPTFQWAEVDGADGYRVTITDAGGARIFSTTTRSARLEGTSLSKPLAAGADYVWKVTALDAPTPAEGATALHVATATERALVRAIVEAVEAVEARGRGAVADLVTAQALLRRGFAAEALPFVRRYVSGLRATRRAGDPRPRAAPARARGERALRPVASAMRRRIVLLARSSSAVRSPSGTAAGATRRERAAVGAPAVAHLDARPGATALR
jgi:hypothetical protein